MDYHIVTDKDGTLHGTNGEIGLSVLKDGDTTLFKRCAMKNAMTPAMKLTTWLVGEIDGVRCYVKQDGLRLHVVMTRRDLYP
jgi:hypothetical protein